MIRREDIVKGAYLRTLSDSLSIPSGTLARVETNGTTWQGEFVFTVRWSNVNTGTQVRPISDRSLNLWEADLFHFEAISRAEAGAVKAVTVQLVRPKIKLAVGGHRRHRKSKTPNLGQLSLFTLEDF
jgi:hypothetical protein